MPIAEPVGKISSVSTGVAAGVVDEDDGIDEIERELHGLWGRGFRRLETIAGTANAITAVGRPPLLEGLRESQGVILAPAVVNTASVTITIDGFGPYDILAHDGSALLGGELDPSVQWPLQFDGADLRMPPGSGGGSSLMRAPDVILHDEKAAGTDGGTQTSGSWVARTLNTSVRNELIGASLASNQITLPPGTYEIGWSAPGNLVGSFMTRLANVTDGIYYYGETARASTAAGHNVFSRGRAVFSITAAKVFELQMRVETTNSGDGGGIAANFGVNEIYSRVEVRKVTNEDVVDTGIPGGPITLEYTFSTTTADADPGDGFLRLNNATQNLATVIRADLKDAAGVTVTDVLALFDDSSSGVKGFIRLVKKDDRTKWLVFTVASLASPAGYRNITVAVVASSAASPFANNDVILLEFGRTGDAGAASSLLTTRGDLFRRGASDVERMPVGATGRVVHFDGTDSVFGTLLAGAFSTGPGIVTPAMLDNGAAVSLLGRSANSSGARADIAAAANDTILRRVSNALDFGGITIGMIADALITYAKLQNISATQRVLGRNTAGAGVTEEVTVAQLLNWLLTTRGDIIVRDAAVPARLALGTAGKQLQSDGTDLVYGYMPPWFSGYVAGRYYGGAFGNLEATSSGNAALAVNTLYAVPFVVQEAHTFDRIAFGVHTPGTAVNARVGIYNFANGVPGSLVLDCGTVAVGSTGVKTVTISQALPRGMYALAIVADGTFSANAVAVNPVTLSLEAIGSGFGITNQAIIFSVAHTYGALPTPFGAVTYSSLGFIMMGLRA